MRILAHRGAHHPESSDVRANTLAAFRLARDLGVDGVELDVRRTADGVLVVVHDAVLPGGAVLAETAAADLPEWLPTLDAALGAGAGLHLINVEIKNSPVEPGFDAGHTIAVEVAAALAAAAPGAAGAAGAAAPAPTAAAGAAVPAATAATGPAAAPTPTLAAPALIVSSFNLATLDAFHAASPLVPTGWLTGAGWDQVAAVASAAAAGHSAINPAESAVTPAVVEAAHAAGLEVVAWTVDDPDRMTALAAMGVDVLVTDRPALALVVRRHDGW